MAKVLISEYQKCTGCRLCELVCSVKQEGVSNPVRSRIQIIKWEMEGRYVPMFCVQCESPVCADVCPVKAISRDETLARVMINYEICIGCRLCVTACPFGGISWDSIGKKAIKCDLCNGQPQCVRFCETGAVQYVESERVSLIKQRAIAEKVSELLQKVAVAMAGL